jgi:hypothetical protein
MASEEKTDKQTRYQSYEEFRRKFYGSNENPDTKERQGHDETASFGKQLAKELVRRG